MMNQVIFEVCDVDTWIIKCIRGYCKCHKYDVGLFKFLF